MDAKASALNYYTVSSLWELKLPYKTTTKMNGQKPSGRGKKKKKRAITEELLLNTGQEPLGTFNLMRQLSLPFNWGLQRLRNLLQSSWSMVPNPRDNLNKGHLNKSLVFK